MYYAAKAALEEDSGAPRAVLEERPKAAPRHDSVTANQTFPALPPAQQFRSEPAQRRQNAPYAVDAPRTRTEEPLGFSKTRCKAGACQRAESGAFATLCPKSQKPSAPLKRPPMPPMPGEYAQQTVEKSVPLPGGGRTPQPRDAGCGKLCPRRNAERSRTGDARRRSADSTRCAERCPVPETPAQEEMAAPVPEAEPAAPIFEEAAVEKDHPDDAPDTPDWRLAGEVLTPMPSWSGATRSGSSTSTPPMSG